MINLGLSLVGQLLGSAIASLEELNTWFLKSGTWDATGAWVDSIPFPTPWFLSSGIFNIAGIWLDDEVWT